MKLARYRKAIVAAGAGLGVIGAALADGQVTATEWVQVGLAVLGALGVFGVENARPTIEDGAEALRRAADRR